MDTNTEKLILSQGLINNNIGFIIPEKFQNYNIVVASSSYDKELQFKRYGIKSALFNSDSDGFQNTAVNDHRHAAMHYCKKLNINGFSDWYLPSKDELNFIFLHSNEFTNNFVLDKNSSYWTSTECSEIRTHAWYINTNTGLNYHCKKLSYNLVRPIRKLIIF
jgi:hypothetical protein